MASDADDGDSPPQSSADGDSSETDDFDDDLAAISRACTLSGIDPNNLQSAAKTPSSSGGDDDDSDSEEDDDELLRNTYQRFSEAALNLKPLSTLPPAGGSDSDDDEDDLAILERVKHRCEVYFKGFAGSSENNKLKTTKQIVDSSVALEMQTSFDFLADKNCVSESFTEPMKSPSKLIDCPYQDNHDVSVPPPGYSSFPNAARLLVNSLNKNRTCQQFLRSKMIQIQARIEENEKLIQRVKILKDFQVACKRRTGRQLCQKKDPRLQLISAKEPNPNRKTKGKKMTALCNGPKDNPHVANYKLVLTKYPISLSREKWTDTEKENLYRGIKQQIQEQLVQKSINLIRNMDGTSSQDLDSIYASIGDLDISPEDIRLFLPKVNWEQLVSLYVPGRSGEECEARWLNFEDPLINHDPWTKMEEKKLLCIIQERGIENWVDIAVSLGKNRTPSQCLAHYQRSLNPSILKSEWTEDEDKQLCAAVEEYGESNWKVVASFLEGRTGTQCSNRWIKTLHPARKMQGKWTAQEDKRLRVAAMLFEPKSWREIAKFVPGRTHVQCRERWSNCLDPDVNMGKWSEEEDAKLIVAFQEHFQVFINSGKCQISWATVAARMPGRTDSQCRRRSLLLFPKLKSLLRDAKKMRARVGLRNFVDRESERPTLAINDFVPPALINSVVEPENRCLLKKRGRPRFKRSAKGARKYPQEELLLTNGDVSGDDTIPDKKKVMRPCQKEKEGSKTIEDMTKNHRRIKRCNVGVQKSSFGRIIRRPRKVDASSSDDTLKGREEKQCQKKHKKTHHTDIQSLGSVGSESPVIYQEEAAHSEDSQEGFSLQQRRGAQIYPEEVLTSYVEVQNFRGNRKSKRRIRKHSLGSKSYVNNVLSDSATVSDDDEPLAKIVPRRTFKAHARKTRTVSHSKSSGTREADVEVKTLVSESTTYADNVSSEATISDDDEPLAKFVPRKRRKTLKAHKRKTCDVSHSKSLQLHPPCSETKEANDEVNVLSGNNTSVDDRKRMFDKVYTRKKKGGSQCEEPRSCRSSWLKVAESHSKQRLSCTRDIPSKNVLDVEEDGNMTLATFIKGKLRKRIKLAEKGNDESCPCRSGLQELPHSKNCCNFGMECNSFRVMQSSGAGDLASSKVNCCEIDSTIRTSSCCNKRSEEGEISDIVGFRKEEDHTSETESPPPGFEHPIYRKEPA